MADTFQVTPPLSPGVGYGIIVGVGAAFAIGMSLLTWVLSRYFNEKQEVEMQLTAHHSLGVGLIASAVVSSWTIAATLLSSTTYAYDYGVSGEYLLEVLFVFILTDSPRPLLVCCGSLCSDPTILGCCDGAEKKGSQCPDLLASDQGSLWCLCSYCVLLLLHGLPIHWHGQSPRRWERR